MHGADADRVPTAERRGDKPEHVRLALGGVPDGTTPLGEEILGDREVSDGLSVVGPLEQAIPRDLRVRGDPRRLLAVLLRPLGTGGEVKPLVVLLAELLVKLSKTAFAGTDDGRIVLPVQEIARFVLSRGWVKAVSVSGGVRHTGLILLAEAKEPDHVERRVSREGIRRGVHDLRLYALVPVALLQEGLELL